MDKVVNLTIKGIVYNRWMGAPSSLQYDNLRELLNRSVELDCCHRRNPGYLSPLGDVLPARVNVGRPTDSHPGAPGPPVGRNLATGNWEAPWPLRQTSDMVHEVFNLYDPNRPGANFCARLFLGRINTIILLIWHYHNISTLPGHIPNANRHPNWENICLYRIPPIHGAVAQHTPVTVFSRPIQINAGHFCKNGAARPRGLDTNAQNALFRRTSGSCWRLPWL